MEGRVVSFNYEEGAKRISNELLVPSLCNDVRNQFLHFRKYRYPRILRELSFL